MSEKRSSITTSVRRHFVDQFFFKHSSLYKGKRVIDIGGKKKNKRGLFDIGKYAESVTYVNLDRTTEPDIESDATNIPLPDNSFDIVILGEILEHVPEPQKVLTEARRLLRPGGTVLATVPFMYPIHADPFDFGRYTDYYWQEAARNLWFSDITVERQGGFYAVLALMVQHFFRSKNISWRPIQNPLVCLLMWLDTKTTNKLLLSWTTGYGIILKK